MNYMKSSSFKNNYIVVLLTSLFLLIHSHSFAVTNVVLVQNSGWMEPFYSDPNSQLKNLVNNLLQNISKGENTLTLATFSQRTATVNSPTVITSGTASSLSQAMSGLNVQYKDEKNGRLADTNFKEALETVAQALRNGNAPAEGIVWLVTNNKNSPNNDADTPKRNREYYEYLHKNENLTKILAWPFKMPVQGKLYKANGLMVYALAFGQKSALELDKITENFARDNSAFSKTRPARLKPQNAEAVWFNPTGVDNNTNVSAYRAKDGKTIVLELDAATKAQTVQLKGHFINAFNLYDIEKAELKARYGANNITITPSKLAKLQAEQSSDTFSLPLTIPAIASEWSLSNLLESGQSTFGFLEIALDQTLTPSKTYENKFREIFPEDPIPDVFKPAEISATSLTKIPVKIIVNNSAWPLLIVIILLLFLLAGLFYIYYFLNKSKKIILLINGFSRTYLVKVNQITQISDDYGNKIGEIERGFFNIIIRNVAENNQILLVK